MTEEVCWTLHFFIGIVFQRRPMGSFDNCRPLCMKAYNKIYYMNTIYIIYQYKHLKGGDLKHAMWFCYCFGYDVTVRFIERQMFHASGLNSKWCKVKFLMKYLSWIGTIPVFTGCTKNVLHCICLKCRWDLLESRSIQIIAAQWLMGHPAPKYVKDVCLILKMKFHTGLWHHTSSHGVICQYQQPSSLLYLNCLLYN